MPSQPVQNLCTMMEGMLTVTIMTGKNNVEHLIVGSLLTQAGHDPTVLHPRELLKNAKFGVYIKHAESNLSFPKIPSRLARG